MSEYIKILVVGATREETRIFESKHQYTSNYFIVFTNDFGYSLAYLANNILCDTTSHVFGMVHADTWLTEDNILTFYNESMKGSVCGIVGRDLEGNYRWAGTHYSPTGQPNQPPNPGVVSTLDGCSIFFKRRFGLRFDEETFDSYHCMNEDLCLQAQARKIPVIVPLAEGCGHPLIPTRGPAWIDQYLVYRKKLVDKWPNTTFTTT